MIKETKSSIANSSGSKVAELRYYPWGGTRYTYQTTPTSYQFTGQRNDAATYTAFGLYFYNARYYDPALSRFISPDSIIPDPANPQDLNRYSYARNNPLRYNDPSGHTEEEITSYFHDISEAEEFLKIIRSVLWLAEYPYDTDWDFLLGIGVNDGGPEGAEALAQVLQLEPALIGWAATLYAAGIDEANKEGLKTLRRFRDDLTDAIAIWQQSTSETMYLEVFILNAGFLQPDVYRIGLTQVSF